MDAATVMPNARAKGRGRKKLGEKHQSVTPRPLERRVGRRTRKEWLLLFAFRSLILRPKKNLLASTAARPTYFSTTANTAAGLVLAIASNVFAAPLGCLRPCSQP